MGRAYEKELSNLSNTFRWACEIPLETLEDFAVEAFSHPLLAIGSGGSVTAAHLAVMLHRYHSGNFAQHLTPLEIVLGDYNLSESSVLLISSSGKNGDILAALENTVGQEARAVATLCTRSGSPLAANAAKYERAYVFEPDVPSGKDGFLATNSLLATCAIIARLYGHQPVESNISFNPQSPEVAGTSACSTALILHGSWGSPIATDLESKLNETALLSAQVSDYRNFGHGRHLGLARCAGRTMVISIVTPETEVLANRTLSLIPAEIPKIELHTKHSGVEGMLDLLVQSFHLVGRFGKLQGFDPGRPQVPPFGRKLYHLKPSAPKNRQSLPVLRKLFFAEQYLPSWRDEVSQALEKFVDHLSETRIGAVVLDYDGTLCGRTERFGSLRQEMSNELARLVNNGLVVGIATGRGRSVRLSLQSTLQKSTWDSVTIGYYNGGIIASLKDDSAPSRSTQLEYPLNIAAELLEQDSLLRKIATLTYRQPQITVEPRLQVSIDSLLSHVMTVISPMEQLGIRTLASSHSVDVLPKNTGKLSVVEAVKQRIQPDLKVLCIGDRGAWPGNDCALLSHTPSLSVDEVSASLETCWNLAPAGSTGPNATLHYLKALHATDGVASMNALNIWSNS